MHLVFFRGDTATVPRFSLGALLPSTRWLIPNFRDFVQGIGYAASFANPVGICDGHEAELYVV